MGRHRAPLTRDNLRARYAAQMNLSVDVVQAIHGNTEIEELRSIVETYEHHAGGAFPRRRSFAQSLPTTSVQGQTR